MAVATLLSTAQGQESSPTPEVSAADRARNLEAALQQIHKDFGDGSIMRLGDNRKMDIEVIPSGNLLIDRALLDEIVSGIRSR